MVAICLRPLVVLFCISFVAPAFANGTVYTPPLNFTGAAVAESIAKNLGRRGFLAGDPRIAQTVASVGSRVPTLAAAAGANSTWIGTISRVTPWVTAGVFVYQGVTWYYDIQGKAYLAPPGSTTTAPVFSNGITSGQQCWGVSSDCFGSPEEALSREFWRSKQQYPTATYGVPTWTVNSPTKRTAAYNYSISELGLNNQSGTKAVNAKTSSVSCPAGSGYLGTGTTPLACTSAQLSADSSPWKPAPVQPKTQQEVYDELDPMAKLAPMSPELVAEIANRLYRDASSQPDYQGVPFSTTTPVTAPDALAHKVANPTHWPKTNALSEPVPTTGTPAVTLPRTNPNQVAPPPNATKIDLGLDPGTPPPTLEDLPTDLMKPIKDVMAPWLSWQVPSHTASCPVWNASPSISGHAFAINVSSHCDIIEDWRVLIAGIAMAGWVIIAAFVVLSA